MNQPVGLTTDLVLELLEQGFTQTEIAEQFGATRQAVQYHARKAGWRSPLQVGMDHLPWKDLKPNERKATPYQQLLHHLEYVADGGRTMREEKLRRLSAWYKRLIELDQVVEYDPTIPPTINQKYGSWRYVPREAGDHDLIVRRNKYTQISDTDARWLRLPKRLP